MEPVPTTEVTRHMTPGAGNVMYVPTLPSYSLKTISTLCGGAYKADVSASGVLRLTPLFDASFRGAAAGSRDTHAGAYCKLLNATGIVHGDIGTAATVALWDVMYSYDASFSSHDTPTPTNATLWDNIAGALLSTLTRTGPDQVALTVPNYRHSGGSCRYFFRVVSGCFLGIRPPPPSAPACPPNHYVAAGVGGAEYCAQCPPATSSPGQDSRACTPCQPGEYGVRFAGGCLRCPPGRHSSTAGSTACTFCKGKKSAGDGMWLSGWTDGKACGTCPAGSTPCSADRSQCHACTGGSRCCTVNPSDDCPACPAGWTPGPNLNTTHFALVSASSPACMASSYALCAPRFHLTVYRKCAVVLKSAPPPWNPPSAGCHVGEYSGFLQGGGSDVFVNFTGIVTSDSALTNGHISAAPPPFLDFTFPRSQCTLRYRALHGSALLGTHPEPCAKGEPGCPHPSPSSSTLVCPAGSYIDDATTAHTTSPPCLPCPPGTHSPAPSNQPCIPCLPDHYAVGYGSTECTQCTPEGPFSPSSTWGDDAIFRKCVGAGSSHMKRHACPDFSYSYASYAPHMLGRTPPPDPADPVACLSNQLGSVCCALGDCEGQAPCPAELRDTRQHDFTAPGVVIGSVLQLVSRHLPLPQCKNATMLWCLDGHGMVLLTFDNVDFMMVPLLQTGCLSNGKQVFLEGGFTSSKSGTGLHQHSTADPAIPETLVSHYNFRSDAANGTVTVSLVSSYDSLAPPTLPHANSTLGECTATFNLTAGYAFDLAPPSGATTCPANSSPAVLGGRTFCKFCNQGSYMNATGGCDRCPPGTHQDTIGATSCKPCPAGTYCPDSQLYRLAEWMEPLPCKGGYHSPEPGSTQCKACPANTYAPPRSASCTPCPKFSESAEGSEVCRMAFPDNSAPKSTRATAPRGPRQPSL